MKKNQIELPEMMNKSSNKNSFEGSDRRLSKAKERINELEDTSEDIINALKRDKKTENVEEKLRCVVDRVRGFIIHLVGVL